MNVEIDVKKCNFEKFFLEFQSARLIMINSISVFLAFIAQVRINQNNFLLLCETYFKT